MVDAAGVRVPWSDLPASVRSSVADILGAPVVEATSQRGGFSPGSADRVVTAEGRRAFVKAVSGSAYPDSAGMHRREVLVTEALPEDAPVPRLIGHRDDGDWVVLVLTDVEGRNPELPWRDDELEATRDAYEGIAGIPLAGGLRELPTAGDRLTHDFAGWERLRDDPDDGLDPWAAANLERLAEAADRARAAVAGDSLVHLDARADNLLVRPDGSVVVVDWPWATRGAAWFDRLTLLVNVGLYDPGAPLEELVAGWLPDVPTADVDATLAGLAAYFCDVARQPVPAGLPTLRPFQRAQGEVVLRWLRERWEAAR